MTEPFTMNSPNPDEWLDTSGFNPGNWLCSTNEVYQAATAKVYKENFGTGDNSETRFYLKVSDQPTKETGLVIIENSETIYIDHIVTTEYQIDYELGEIIFTTAPTSDTNLSASFEHSLLRKISDTVLFSYIKRAHKFIESLTGYKFELTPVIEIFDPPNVLKIGALAYYCVSRYELLLNYRPIEKIEYLFIDNTKISKEKVYLEPQDFPMKIKLARNAEKTYFSSVNEKSIKVGYWYGFDLTSENSNIRRIASQAKEACIILSFLEAAGANIYGLAWTATGFVNFGAWSVDRGTYLTPGDAQIERWVKNVENILKSLPKATVVQ